MFILALLIFFKITMIFWERKDLAVVIQGIELNKNSENPSLEPNVFFCTSISPIRLL